jgi:hypothetical protein
MLCLRCFHSLLVGGWAFREVEERSMARVFAFLLCCTVDVLLGYHMSVKKFWACDEDVAIL